MRGGRGTRLELADARDDLVAKGPRARAFIQHLFQVFVDILTVHIVMIARARFGQIVKHDQAQEVQLVHLRVTHSGEQKCNVQHPVHVLRDRLLAAAEKRETAARRAVQHSDFIQVIGELAHLFPPPHILVRLHGVSIRATSDEGE